MTEPDDLLAVLVGANNVAPSRIPAILNEIAQYGVASVKRMYDDWAKPNLRGWKDAAGEHVIQPIQQFDNTTGKNATDSALIIDAMDLLYTGRFRGFCIISPAWLRGSASRESRSTVSANERRRGPSGMRAIASPTSTSSNPPQQTTRRRRRG
ncbi:NYN domain-containing protein [Microbacterium sp. LRZ72]|nr:NYN domain-containing protein [Microbacterium sp. LRZ72]MDX2377220.1 NYN domain-containing protein [Microbacterium sp. LRZ72]